MMMHVISGMLALAMAGAGIFNALATPSTQQDFIRWGYPAWWARVTGAIEIALAILLIFAPTRNLGLVGAAAVVLMATLTVIRHREWSHLIPLSFFAILISLVITLTGG